MVLSHHTSPGPPTAALLCEGDTYFFFFLITFPPSTDAQIELWGKLDHWSAKSQSWSRHVQVPDSSGCASCWSITDVEADASPPVHWPRIGPARKGQEPECCPPGTASGPGPPEAPVTNLQQRVVCTGASLGGRDESFQPSGTLTATQERPRPVPPSS